MFGKRTNLHERLYGLSVNYDQLEKRKGFHISPPEIHKLWSNLDGGGVDRPAKSDEGRSFTQSLGQLGLFYTAGASPALAAISIDGVHVTLVHHLHACGITKLSSSTWIMMCKKRLHDFFLIHAFD